MHGKLLKVGCNRMGDEVHVQPPCQHVSGSGGDAAPVDPHKKSAVSPASSHQLRVLLDRPRGMRFMRCSPACAFGRVYGRLECVKHVPVFLAAPCTVAGTSTDISAASAGGATGGAMQVAARHERHSKKVSTKQPAWQQICQWMFLQQERASHIRADRTHVQIHKPVNNA